MGFKQRLHSRAFKRFLTSALAILAIVAGVGIHRATTEINELPSASDLEDVGVMTFRPYDIKSFAVTRNEHPRPNRTREIKTYEYHVYYRSLEEKPRRFSYHEAAGNTEALAQRLYEEGNKTWRVLTYDEAKIWYRCDPAMTAEDYIAERTYKNKLIIGVCSAYLMFFVVMLFVLHGHKLKPKPSGVDPLGEYEKQRHR